MSRSPFARRHRQQTRIAPTTALPAGLLAPAFLLACRSMLAGVIRASGLRPCLIVLALLTAGLFPTGAWASANANWGAGVEASPPANAGTTPIVSLSSASCSSAGNCSAVGTYFDSSNHTQGLLLTETSGTWASGAEASLPADAAASPFVYLSSVSCASAGNCTAVGQYTDSSNATQGLLLTQTAGAWAPGVEAPLPANASATQPAVHLSSVSCASAGDCTAVGQYYDSSNNTQGLLLTETSGTWTPSVEAPLPANAYASPQVQLNSVSCVSAGECIAVGQYYDSSNVRQGVFLTQSSGGWATGAEAQLPANANTNPQVALVSVSCPSSGNCAAAGSYVDTSSHIVALTFDAASGAWRAGQELSLPAGAAASPDAGLNAISCGSAGTCSAVGFYTDSFGQGQGLLASETSGTWSSESAPLPANASSTNTGAVINAISCISPGNCAAVGKYQDGSNHQQGLLLTQSAGTWATGVQATPPAGASSSPGLYPSSVSCAAAGNCSVVGYYYDSSNHQQGFFIGAMAATPGLSLSAPSSGWSGQTISSSSVAAALSGGADPTGTVTFKVFGPQSSAPSSCGSGGTTPGTGNVSGNGTYNPSAGFTPSSAGDYWWYASYGGDAGNNPAASACGSSMAETVVTSPPPSSSSPPSVNGTAQQGQTLTESHGQWSNNPTSYAYQWENCDSSGNNCSAVSGATTQSYTLTSSDVGHTIRVVETASNSGGDGQTASSATGVVAPASSAAGGVVPGSPATVSISASGAASRSGRSVDPGIILSCPTGGPACSVDEQASVLIGTATTPIDSGARGAHPVEVATASFTIPAGGSVEAVFQLNQLGMTLLSDHKHLQLQVEVSGQTPGATPVTATKAVVLAGTFAHYKVSAIKVDRNRTISLRVNVTAPGQINVLATAWKDNVAGVARLLNPATGRFVVARATVHAAKPGVLRLQVRPNARGRRLLTHPAYRVTLRLWVSYIPLDAFQTDTGYYALHPGGGCPPCHTRTWP